MDLERRLELATRNAEEVVTLDELKSLLETCERPKAYIGFELSGLMHVGIGLVCASKIIDLIEAGFDFTILLADWHSWINNKLGGDMGNIRLCGEYFKQCFEALGIPSDRVRYVWGSELAERAGYWEKVIRIAKGVTVQRLGRAITIMGRELGLQNVEAAWLFYPCMQVADIFELGVDCALAGMDQRKAHMLAREAAERLGYRKPICIHTHLLQSLAGPQAARRGFDEDPEMDRRIGTKMSKSVPSGCLYVHDPPEEIRAKLRKAYCPPRQAEDNPVLELAKYAIFPRLGKLRVEREDRYGGTVEFRSYGELEGAYVSGSLHPLDLKNAVADALIEILGPVRRSFEERGELLAKVSALEATR